VAPNPAGEEVIPLETFLEAYGPLACVLAVLVVGIWNAWPSRRSLR
jgi:hypothetical protein